MRAAGLIVVAAGLSHAHALATAGGWPTPAEADGYVRLVDLFGTVSRAALTMSFLPFHVAMAAGLWLGGRAVGGTSGGALAMVAGLGAAGVLTAAAQATTAFPLAGCVALAVGAGLAGRWPWALVGASGLVAAVVAPRSPLSVEAVLTSVQPVILVGVVGALLLRGDAPTLKALGAAIGVVAGAFLADLPAVVVVPPLAMAAAGVAVSRGALAGLAGLVTAQIIGYHTTREAWPGRPDRPVREAPGDALILTTLLNGFATRGSVVATYSLHERLHAGVFAVAAAERGLPLRFVSTDAPTSDLGLVIRPEVGATPREGWRTQLPLRDGALELGDGYVMEVWHRGLPPESLLAAKVGEERNHPSQQALYAYTGGREVGPLIPDASSPEVVETDRGVEALFVRNQALWHASGDGTRFGAPRPLLDAAGAPIAAFDPNVVRLEDGTFRLYAAELVGDDRTVDPALHPTRIVSWRGATLDKLTREPGERLSGIGVVDPAIEHRGGLWILYVTTDRRYVSRAESDDGLTFGPLEPYVEATVPAVTPIGLVVQRQVMGWSVLHLYDPKDRLINPTGGLTSLDLCGTGASWARGALYYTRAAEPCPEPVVMPEKRAWLDALLALRAWGERE